MSKLPPLPRRDTSKPVEQQGIFRKFYVERTDGSSDPGRKHYGCEYFVLDINHDPAARAALKAYADAVEATHPELAADMRNRYALEFARAIEAAATEPLLQRIAELERKSDQDDETILWQAKEISEKTDKLAELERQLEEASKDAERYRWLRANWFTMTATYHDKAVQFYPNGPKWSDQSTDAVDAAIDAAMQKGQS